MGAIDDFKQSLERYGLQAKFDHFLQAIRSSFLSEGRLAIELPEQDAQVLRQLDMGWPGLSEDGRRIGRELVDSAIHAKPDVIAKALASVPPKVVALFGRAAQRDKDVYSLRIAEETKGFEILDYASSLTPILEYKSVHPHVIALVSQLVQQDLAVMYVAPAYSRANWKATFIYYPAAVAELITRFVVDQGVILENADRLLNEYSLLRKSPVPSLREFDLAGISKETLHEYMGNALDRHIVTKVVEEGPAFLVLDQKSYEQVVLRPSFERIVDELLSQAKAPVLSENGPEEDSDSETIALTNGHDAILVGSSNENDSDLGLLGWADEKRILLDMFVGQIEHEDRAHTISVFGIPKFGKSYSLGAIIEMALAPQNAIRRGPPLPVVVFHYDSNVTYKPEFANLAYPASDPQNIRTLKAQTGAEPKAVNDVVILVPPWRVEERVKEFPGAKVQPLTFSSSEMGTPEWLLLMGVPGSEALYISQMKDLFLSLEESGEITLKAIRQKVRESDMSEQAIKLALQRLNLAKRWINDQNTLQEYLRPGRLVILDIRDTMIDASDAMRLCLISLGLFQRVQTEDGSPMPKLIVLDEAHKYVQKEFAKEMETVVNQMRHTATSVAIASQSPDSIPANVLEKSSIVLLHRITGPNQIRYLKKAVQGLSGIQASKVASLEKGHCIIWSSESTDSRVSNSGIEMVVRPRYTRHVWSE